MNLTCFFSPDRRTLTILADDQARSEFSALGNTIHLDTTLSATFEPLLSNSDLQWIPPVVCGDLTDAPILGITGKPYWTQEHRNGDGTILCGRDSRRSKPVSVATVDARWGFMDYQVKSVLGSLRDTGQAVFRSP